MLDGLLPGMRDMVLRTLETPIGVKARTRTRTATGGSTYTWATAATVLGRFQAVGNDDQEFAVKMGVEADHVAILPHDANVSVDDRLVVGGVEYSITGVMKHEIPVLVKVMCSRVAE